MTDRRQFEPEELAAIAACSVGTGDLLVLARTLKRPYSSVLGKKRELIRAAKARQDCGAFMPDNGLPYRVRMQRIHREFVRTP